MNDVNNDLVKVEPAARMLCQLRGQDPNEELRTPHPLGLMVDHTTTAWKLAAEEVIAIMQVLTAINTQRRAEKAEPVPH